MGCLTISKDIIAHRRVIKEYVRNLEALRRKSQGKNVVFKTAKWNSIKSVWYTMA